MYILLPTQTIDPSLKQFIANVVISAITTAVTALQARYNDNMLFLCKIIKKFLYFNASPLSSTPTPNIKAFAKALTPTEDAIKASSERCIQAQLGYFNPYLDKVNGKGKVMLIRKNVYYRNMVLFLQRFQSFVTSCNATLVKTNIPTSLCSSALKWYILEFSNFDWNALNNNIGIKSWINTLSTCFKIPTTVILNLLTDKTYSLNNLQACCPPV